MKKSLKIILISLLALIAVLAVAVFVFYQRVNNPENVFAPASPAPATPAPTQGNTPAPGSLLSPGAAAEPSPTVTPQPTPTPMSEAELASLADASFMKNRVNILVLGIDRSVERLESGSFRSDTIILVTVNFKTMDVDMISFPRDSYVKLYNKKAELIDPVDPFNKINAAFSLGGGVEHGGYQSMMNTVSAVMGGIPVNYYVSFDMNAVKEIVNAMGGVDYEVDIEVSMNGRVLHPGMQHLNGQAVLDYCRQRKGSSDTARVDRQQRMLKAIFNQMKTTGQIANIPKIYQAVSDAIETDLSFEQICSLSLIALRMDMDQLGRHMVEGKFQSLYSRDIWCIDGEKLTKLMKEVFGAEVTIDPEIDGEAILATTAANNAAVQRELTVASYLYNEAKTVMSAFKNSMSSATYSAMSKAKSKLAEAIRRENKAYLDQYSLTMDQLLSTAYGEAGAARPAHGFIIPVPAGETAAQPGNDSGVPAQTGGLSGTGLLGDDALEQEHGDG